MPSGRFVAAQLLQNGVSVSGLSGETGSQKHFRLDVKSGARKLTFWIRGPSGDADVYVRYGYPPTVTDYDFRPYLEGSTEMCQIQGWKLKTGSWYVMVHGYEAYTDLSIRGTFS